MLTDESNLNGNGFCKRTLYLSLHIRLLFLHCHFAVVAVDRTPRREYFRLVFTRFLLYLEYLLCALHLKVVDLSLGSVGSRRFGLLSLRRHFSASGYWGFSRQDIGPLEIGVLLC